MSAESDNEVENAEEIELDPDIEMMLPPCRCRPYTEDHVIVNLSDAYNRKPLPANQERYVDDVWAERLRDNPRLWDGSKFRMHSVGKMEDGTAIFNLGITGYKDFLCTNYSPRVKDLQALGRTTYGDSQSHLADPFGVGALVHTADDYFFLLRRSDFCGEAVGLLDVPGGHPEPEELVGKIPASDVDLKIMSPKAVVHEIFDSIHREICDEVNLPKDEVTFPVLLGIVRNTPSAGRPTAEFYSKCSLSSDEVKRRYREGTQLEAVETTDIVFIPVSAILDLHSNNEYADIWRQMTASAKGCMTLFRCTLMARKYRKDKVD